MFCCLDRLFVFGLEVAKRADGSGEFAHPEIFGGGVEAGEVALHLGVPEEEFEAEGAGFGVDAVGAADDGGVLELDGAFFEGFGEGDDAGTDDGGGFFELQGLCGIDDVGGGEAVMEPAGVFGGVDVLGYGGGEGDDVVLDLSFDFVDAIDGEGSAIANGVGCGLRPAVLSTELGARRGGCDGGKVAAKSLCGRETGARVAITIRPNLTARAAFWPV